MEDETRAVTQYTSLKGIFNEFFGRLKDYFSTRLFDLSSSAKKIPNGADLNNYKTSGTYRCTSATVGKTLLNCPYTTSNFKLIVDINTGADSSSYGSQTIISGSSNGYIAHRGFTDISWGDWKVMTMNGECLPLSGGTMTGSITMKPNSNIKFQGTKETAEMIKFYDNTSNTAGNGIGIGYGGITVIGAGECRDKIISELKYSASTEKLVLGSDSQVEIYSKCDTISERQKFVFEKDGTITLPYGHKIDGGIVWRTLTPEVMSSASSMASLIAGYKPGTIIIFNVSWSEYQSYQFAGYGGYIMITGGSLWAYGQCHVYSSANYTHRLTCTDSASNCTGWVSL